MTVEISLGGWSCIFIGIREDDNVITWNHCLICWKKRYIEVMYPKLAPPPNIFSSWLPESCIRLRFYRLEFLTLWETLKIETWRYLFLREIDRNFWALKIFWWSKILGCEKIFDDGLSKQSQNQYYSWTLVQHIFVHFLYLTIFFLISFNNRPLTFTYFLISTVRFI